VLNGAVEEFNSQAAASNDNWTKLQAQINARTEAAKKIYGEDTAAAADDPTGGSTIMAKSKKLAELIAQARQQRGEQEVHLNNAIQFFKDAASAATSLQNEVKTKQNDPNSANKPDVVAWKSLEATLNPARINAQVADALIRRADLYAGKAKEAQRVLQTGSRIKPVLDDAKLNLPDAFRDDDNKLTQDAKKGVDDARESYKEATDLFSNIAESVAPEDLKKSAHVSNISSLYAWSLFEAGQGDKQAAADRLKMAQSEADVAQQNGTNLKGLPPELIPAKPATPEAPAGAPTTPTTPG